VKREVQQARYAVKRAIASGTLPRLDGTVPCADCGRPAKDYDHRDYSEKLAVAPVCHSCNSKRGPATGWFTERIAGRFPIRHAEDLRKSLSLTPEEFSIRIQYSYNAYPAAIERGYMTRRMAREISLRFGIPMARFKGADGEHP